MVGSSRLPAQATSIVADLQQRDPRVYWTDFLVSLAIGYGCTAGYLTAPLLSARQVLCFVVAGLALYRLMSFIHEIAHFGSGEMPWFRVAWNLLAGIPMLAPSFFYESHRDHHNTHRYATRLDGEYLRLRNRPWTGITAFLSDVVLLQPILLTLRFLLAPVTLLDSRLRRWTLEHASSFVLDRRYRRPISARAPLGWWALTEMACCLWITAVSCLVFTGLIPWSCIPLLYLLTTFVLSLNYVRTLSAHGYRCGGDGVSYEEQLSDSTTITGWPFLSELLFPLGLRYHALHHWFPTLPYHNLGAAHRRLLAQLSADSLYHATVYPSWYAVVRELWRR